MNWREKQGKKEGERKRESERKDELSDVANGMFGLEYNVAIKEGQKCENERRVRERNIGKRKER